MLKILYNIYDSLNFYNNLYNKNIYKMFHFNRFSIPGGGKYLYFFKDGDMRSQKIKGQF